MLGINDCLHASTMADLVKTSELCRMATDKQACSRNSIRVIRHYPAFGIAAIMPHAALPSDLRPSLSSGRR